MVKRGDTMIGDKLKELRESTGMNKKDFAAYLGVKYTTYNNYEVGTREPASDFLILISRKLDVSIDYIMGLSDEKEKTHSYRLKSSEYEHIKKYRSLDDYGKDIIDTILEKEYARCEDEYVEIAARGGKYKVKREALIELAKRLDAEPYEEDHDLC